MVDEAQDLTPAMAAVIRRHITKDQVTLLGDFNQRTRIDAMKTWDQVKSSLGLAQLERASLTRSYRVPKPALDLASRVLSTDQRRLAPEGVRLGEPPEFHRTTAKLLLNEVAKVIKKSDEGQILVVASQEFVNSFETGDDRVVCVNAQKANGLEASLVIVVEPSSWTTESAESRQLLYVALTRTMTRLVIVYSEELPFGLSKPTKGKRRQKQPTKSTSRLRSFWSRS
jgi:DNA helicase IV